MQQSEPMSLGLSRTEDNSSSNGSSNEPQPLSRKLRYVVQTPLGVLQKPKKRGCRFAANGICKLFCIFFLSLSKLRPQRLLGTYLCTTYLVPPRNTVIF